MQAIASMLDREFWQSMDRATVVSWIWKGLFMVGAIAAFITARNWWEEQTMPPPRTVKIQQTWELEPGSRIVDYRVVAGLGDISIDLRGGSAKAPFAGEVHPLQEDCVIFSSPEVPAYMFRFCGLQRVAYGNIHRGGTIGKAHSLHFATLRKQPDGSWALVEPARDVLEKVLAPSRF